MGTGSLREADPTTHLKGMIILRVLVKLEYYPKYGSWEGLPSRQGASLLAVVTTASGLERRIGGKTSQPSMVIK
jgi:hypothetical protein